MTGRFLLILFGFLFAFAATARAQDPDRGTVLGWVEHAGEKRAGVEVVLLSRPMPKRVDVGDADIVRVVTDARGRFRAKCLRGRSYSAWAWWPEDGGRIVTEVAEHVVPGPVIALRDGELRRELRVRFTGLALWQVRGAPTATAYSNTDNVFAVPLKIGDDDSAVLPPMPGSNWDVELRAADGQLLSNDGVNRKQVSDIEIEVSPPTRLVVVVKRAKAAVVGARIATAPYYGPGARHPRLVPVPLAETDGGGRAEMIVPRENPLGNARGQRMVMISAKGCAESLFDSRIGGAGGLVTARLAPGHVVSGRLVDKQGRPAAGVSVYVEHTIEFAGTPNANFGKPPMPVVTDAEGRFAVFGLNGHGGFRVLLVLTPDEARELGFAAAADRSLAPVLWIASRETVSDDVDLGTIAVDQIPICRLEVVRHSGEPAIGARIQALGGTGFGSPIEYHTDRVGRLQFAVPSKDLRIGVFVPGDGIALATVPSADGHALRLTLSEPATITGMVTDADGKPVEGARVRPWGRPKDMPYELANLAFWSNLASAPTGADGRYRVTVPSKEYPYQLRAWAMRDGTTSWSRAFWFGPGDLDDVGLQLDKK